MKYIKLFESYTRQEEFLRIGWKDAKIGDTQPEDIIYQYAQELHRNYDDFVDGDLGERIEEFSEYQLVEINIDDIDIEEWEIDEDIVNDYVEEYETNKNYPPIIIGDDYSIIDGTHRANALDKLGIKRVKAWLGIN